MTKLPLENLPPMALKGLFALRRRAHLALCRHLTPAQRMGIVLSRHSNADAALRGRIREVEADGAPCLELSIDGRVFRIPCPKGEDRDTNIRHFSQVVSESYVDPILFFGDARPKPGDVVLDLGANIGTTAAVLSRIVGPSGRIYAFEPAVEAILKKNLELNGIENVEVVSQAVGEAPGTIEISTGNIGMDSSVVTRLDWHKELKKVPITSLDRFVEERGLSRIDFIKMDIEGAEEPALRGARELIRRFRPKWSISSYHTDASGDLQHAKLMTLLREHGYRAIEVPGHHIFAI